MVEIEFKTQPEVSPSIDVGFPRTMNVTCHKTALVTLEQAVSEAWWS